MNRFWNLRMSTGRVFRAAGYAAAIAAAIWTGGPVGTSRAADRPAVSAPQGSPVDINGALSVCRGRFLCNEDRKPVQLRGISSHGLQWYAQCIRGKSLRALANDWKADVVRLAVYIQEGGYELDPRRYRDLVNELIDEATAKGLYVIIDWHVLTPGDPYYNLELAKQFFRSIARRNKDKNNILYEVANEPNGVSWDLIRSYHEEIIPVIRRQDKDAVILLGTRAWSSMGLSEGARESEVLDEPVDAENVVYTFHFYAGSHKEQYRSALRRAASKLPMFVSEFGMQEFTGDGPNDMAETKKYLRLMKRKKIGWTYWNFSDDWRSGATFETGTCPDGQYSGTRNLKESGRWIRRQLRQDDDFQTN
ncbi:glycoside hydrolase family 5 protein [Microbaculum marinum]|uniref:Glycoside hydrolase family 5 protein n=1 Tax=Microbaculum marinum TaxID=1764581 RepID=A0AAW9RZ76_9HYPH